MKTEIYYGYEKDYMSFEVFSKVVDEYETSHDYKIVEDVKIVLKEGYDIEHCFIALENIKYNDHSL